MKNFFFTILFLLLYLNSQAQSWAPVRVGETYHYTKSSSTPLALMDSFPLLPNNHNGNYILDSFSVIKNIPNQEYQNTFTIGVDSVVATAGVQEFYYSQQLTQCSNCSNPIALQPFQPSDSILFFPRVAILANGNYSLIIQTDSIQLAPTVVNTSPSYPIQDFWVNADSIYWDSTCSDSVVIISIKDSAQTLLPLYRFHIAKNEGIKKLYKDGSLLYEWIGREGTTNSGLTRLTFEQIYNFNIGDIFYYDMYEFDGTGVVFRCVHVYYQQRMTVLNKQIISPDSILYTFEQHKFTDSTQCPEPAANKLDTIDILYTNTGVYQLRQGELRYFYNLPPNPLYIDAYIACKDLFLHQLKYVGYDLGSVPAVHSYYYPHVFYPSSTSPLVYEDKSAPANSFAFLFSEDLGAIFEGYWLFEHGYTKELVGYIKGQDTVGIITDPVVVYNQLTTTTAKNKNYWQLLSNPAQQSIQLKTSPQLIVGQYEIVVYDIFGNQVLQQQKELTPNQSIQLNAHKLATGMYVILLQQQNQILDKIKVMVKP